jgi:23S rRNA pseudouridine2605 synthase
MHDLAIFAISLVNCRIGKHMNEQGEKLQKVLAQAGLGSRRMMETWIESGRVTVNGEPLAGDLIKADRRTIRVGERENEVRVLLYHKPEGEIVSRDDPEKRLNVFDKLPKLRGQKWIAIGRLDFNTSGLLIFTTSGDLANRLMHPRFEVEREYAVRVQGKLSDEQIEQMLKSGVTLDDGMVKFEKLEDHGGEGFNHWYHVMLKEGRNRIVRRSFDALGLPVSRLIRIRFGIVNLPPRLKRGMTAELGQGEIAQILTWVGECDKIPLSDVAGVGQESTTEYNSPKSVVGKKTVRRIPSIPEIKNRNISSRTGIKR